MTSGRSTDTRESYATSGPAAERITRAFAATIGVGGTVYASAVAPQILHQSHLYASWWSPTAVVLIFGAGLVLAAASFRTKLATVRRLAAVLALNYLLSVALAPLALGLGDVPTQSTWQYRIAALGAISAGLAWRPQVAGVYLVVASAAATVTNMIVLGEVGVLALVQDFGRCFATAGLFTWVVVSAVRAASVLETETSRAERAAAAAAAAAARGREKDRFAGLIHDSVLSILLDASRGPTSVVQPSQASLTLRQLNQFRIATSEDSELDAATGVEYLSDVVQRMSGPVDFAVIEQPGFDELRLPIDVAATIASAMAEAIRNSLRHGDTAGRPVRRTVEVLVGPDGIRVDMCDDGAGFDPRHVPRDRLGLVVSIIGRMRQLPGGSVVVESQKGRGTKVRLAWELSR